jgi:hypothetical protein
MQAEVSMLPRLQREYKQLFPAAQEAKRLVAALQGAGHSVSSSAGATPHSTPGRSQPPASRLGQPGSASKAQPEMAVAMSPLQRRRLSLASPEHQNVSLVAGLSPQSSSQDIVRIPAPHGQGHQQVRLRRSMCCPMVLYHTACCRCATDTSLQLCNTISHAHNTNPVAMLVAGGLDPWSAGQQLCHRCVCGQHDRREAAPAGARRAHDRRAQQAGRPPQREPMALSCASDRSTCWSARRAPVQHMCRWSQHLCCMQSLSWTNAQDCCSCCGRWHTRDWSGMQ